MRIFRRSTLLVLLNIMVLAAALHAGAVDLSAKKNSLTSSESRNPISLDRLAAVNQDDAGFSSRNQNAARNQSPVTGSQDGWQLLWGVSAVIILVTSLISLLVVIRKLHKQIARKTKDLTESERLLSTLMGNLPGMAYRRGADLSGAMDIVSQGCLELTGYSPDEVKAGCPRYSDLIHPDDHAMVSQVIRGQLSSGRGFRLQYRLVSKDSRVKWVLEQGIGVADPDCGSLSVEGFLFDISEYVAAQDALQKSREKYRAIFENATEGIFQIDINGKLLTANRALAEIFGFSTPEEMVAAAITENSSFLLDSFLQDKLMSLITQHSRVTGFEAVSHRRNGTPVTISINARGLRDASHNIYQIEGVVTDITERKEAERLRIERDAAEAANKTKGDFLANVGHEIRTPLNSILGFSQILKAQLKDERLKQYIQAITTSGNTLLRLINDLLDLSKIEAGKLELQPTAVDLKRIAREIKMVFMTAVDEKQLEFLVDLDPALPDALFLDEVRLRQILFNLLKNAFKFTDRGKISLSMKTFPGAHPGSVNMQIVVADTGVGIPAEEKETIFEAFAQRKNQDQSKYAGTGLGLSITRRLVEIIGGEISLQSEVGKGSTFTALLQGIPIVDFDRQSLQRKEDDGIVIRFDEEAVILVIDAIDSNRMLIREYLRSTRLSIVETINIADGIEWCMAVKPDLILLDYSMSYASDGNLVQRFNRVKKELNIPVVAVTSSSGVGGDDFQTSFHFDGWLRKPFLFDDVMQTLARFLPHSTFYQGNDSGLLSVRQEGYALPDPEEVRQSVAKLEYRILGLRRILVGNMMEQWKENRETCIINEIKTFAEEIQRLAMEFELDFLAEWASVLLIQVRAFDMERLPETFGCFANLVEMIEEGIQLKEVAADNLTPTRQKGI